MLRIQTDGINHLMRLEQLQDNKKRGAAGAPFFKQLPYYKNLYIDSICRNLFCMSVQIYTI